MLLFGIYADEQRRQGPEPVIPLVALSGAGLAQVQEFV